jgi:hypothetical protein
MSAAPVASSSGTAAAAAIKIRVVGLRVRTGIPDVHPLLAAPTTQRVLSSLSVIRNA